MTSSVSFVGPLGPDRSRPSASTPPWAKVWLHRHNVTVDTPNAPATSREEEILIATSCTAANRRPTSSAAE